MNIICRLLPWTLSEHSPRTANFYRLVTLTVQITTMHREMAAIFYQTGKWEKKVEKKEMEEENARSCFASGETAWLVVVQSRKMFERYIDVCGKFPNEERWSRKLATLKKGVVADSI